jgi:hypothetical protein
MLRNSAQYFGGAPSPARRKAGILTRLARYLFRASSSGDDMNTLAPPRTSKTCTKCGQSKPLELFAINRLGKHGRRADCRSCFAIHKADYRQRVKMSEPASSPEHKKCSRCRLTKSADHFQFDSYAPDKLSGRCSECNRARCSEWQRQNKDKDCARVSRRRAVKLRATVGWACELEMARFYEQARLLTQSTGIKHVVDHIVPLQSKIVCGLHVQDNLKVITKLDNSSKGNRWWPDMPGEEE